MKKKITKLLYKDNGLPMWLVNRTINLVKSLRYEMAKELFDTWRNEYLASEEVEFHIPYRVLDFPDWLNQEEK